jgi:hypothetical protein
MSPVYLYSTVIKMVYALHNSIRQYPLSNSRGDNSGLRRRSTNSLWRFLAVAQLTIKLASFLKLSAFGTLFQLMLFQTHLTSLNSNQQSTEY